MEHDIIREIEPLLRLVVKAIEKGVGEDIREYKTATHKATDNAIRLMRADNINTNLRDNVVSDIIELKYFKRFSWTGCLLIDRLHKFTFTICTKQTLKGIPMNKNRHVPHYLQTILHIENEGVEPMSDQPNLFYYPQDERFSDEEYRRDYEKIMEDDISFDDEYLHWVIAYEAVNYSVTSISMMKLDKFFQMAKEIKLESFLAPDYSELTMEEDTPSKNKDVHSLISVKPKKNIDRVLPKRKEEEKQA